jgi:hypothetical protein
MNHEVKTLNDHIASLQRLESDVSKSTSCLFAPDQCRLTESALKARPAINAAMDHFKRMKKRLLHQTPLNLQDEN